MSHILSISLFTLCFIIVHVSSTPVNILGSTKKLSTNIIYAIYNVNFNDYLQYGDRCELFDVCIRDYSRSIETIPQRYHWQIELQESSGLYALKPYNAQRYMYYKDLPWIRLKNVPEPQDDMGFEFKILPDEIMNDLPTIQIWGEHDNQLFYSYADDGMVVTNKESKQSDSRWKKSKWVFIPLTIPTSCEHIEYEEPESLKLLTSQIDSANTVDCKNTLSDEATCTSPQVEVCHKVITTWSRTDSSELTFGFKIGYESPESMLSYFVYFTLKIFYTKL